MIYGIGTDIADVRRVVGALSRHGDAFADRILATDEREDYLRAADKARHLAKRFAAKEAFAKALRLGVRAPATLHAMRVTHDGEGAPVLTTAPDLTTWMARRGLRAHLSISDEADYAVAFVVVEQLP